MNLRFLSKKQIQSVTIADMVLKTDPGQYVVTIQYDDKSETKKNLTREAIIQNKNLVDHLSETDKNRLNIESHPVTSTHRTAPLGRK